MTSRTISLVVTILYSGDKAQYIAADNQNDGVRILWEDLPHVKLPYPKRENTTFVSYETMGLFGYEFFWPSVKEFGVSRLKHIPWRVCDTYTSFSNSRCITR